MEKVKESQSPLSLLYIINTLDTGGAEIGMCRLLDGLNTDQYDTTVVSLNGSNPAFVRRIPDNVTVIDLKKDSISKVPTLISNARNADVIVGSLYHSVLLARLFRLLNNDAVIATWWHNEVFKTEIRKHVIRVTNRLSDVILADSEPVAKMYQNEFSVDERFVKVVPIAGVKLNKFELRSHQNKETVIVGSVGRLVPQKNYHTLIEIAEYLSRENILFRVAGDGPLRSELEDQINTKCLDNIELVGEVEDIPAFLTSVDIYVQPSRWEGLCMTVIEAMAAGLPVVASPVGGIEYNIIDNVNGFLHEPDDVEGYSESILELASNPMKRQKFGQDGHEIVKESYTQQKLVSEFEKAIRDI